MTVKTNKRCIPTVAIFQYDLGIGGVQRSLLNMLQNIKRDKYSIDLYIVDTDSFYETTVPEYVNIIKIRPFPVLAKLLPFWIIRPLFSKRVKQDILSKKYDASIDFNGYQHITALGALNTEANRHYTWIHDDNYDRKKSDFAFLVSWFMQRAKYKYFDKAVAVSSGLEYSILMTTKLTTKDIIIINNYIDTVKIIQDSRKPLGIKLNADQYHLVSVGRLARQKGIDIMLEAFKRVTAVRTDMHLHIIGDGSECQKLKQLTKQLGLLDRVTFYGAQSNPYKYMSRMDGFISTSRHEGQGINILEAKCLGLDIFIPEHLEKYSYHVKASKSIVDSVSRAVKKPRKVHDELASYNQTVLRGVDAIFRGRV